MIMEENSELVLLFCINLHTKKRRKPMLQQEHFFPIIYTTTQQNPYQVWDQINIPLSEPEW